MSKINDGGPAFPVFVEHSRFNDDTGKYEDYHLPEDGMSLRDYFAAKVMQASMSNDDFYQACKQIADEDGIDRPTAVARFSYDMADAMLKEREK